MAIMKRPSGSKGAQTLAGNRVSVNRVIVDERKRSGDLKQITRRGFIYGSFALSAVGRTGFSQMKGGGRLLLVGTQTTGTSKGIYAYSFESG